MNCTNSTESDAPLSELIAKYREGGAYQIAQVYPMGLPELSVMVMGFNLRVEILLG